MFIEFKDNYNSDEIAYLTSRWQGISRELLASVFALSDERVGDALAGEIKEHLCNLEIPEEFIGVDWRGINLMRWDMDRSSNSPGIGLKRVRLELAKFDEIDLREADFTGANLRWATLLRCNLKGAHFKDVRAKRAIFEQCLLEGADFTDAKLYQVVFVNCNLEHALMKRTICEEVRFAGADMRGLKMESGVNLRRAVFENINMEVEDADRWSAAFGGASVLSSSPGPDEWLRNRIWDWAEKNRSWMVKNQPGFFDSMECYKFKKLTPCPLRPIRAASRVMVGIPFAPDFDTVYAHGIEPAVKAVGLSSWRADQEFGSGDVLCKVCFEIQQSHIAVFDVTGNNANVMLELGLALGRNIPVVLVRSSIGDHGALAPEVITDLKGMEFIEYESPDDLRNKLMESLRDMLRKSGSSGIDPRDAMELWQYEDHWKMGIGRFSEDA